MRSDLVVKYPNLPLKSYSKETLSEILEGSFLFWISDLLCLTGEESAKRLYNAIPAIEKHFWSLGIDEVKKAFTMYADGELTTKPIPNYFTRVLVGQIFNEYRERRVIKKKPIIDETPEEVKRQNISSAFKKCIAHYKETNLILDGYLYFLYDLFYDDGYLPNDPKVKKQYYKDAQDFLRYRTITEKPKSIDERKEFKRLKIEIEKSWSSSVVAQAKEMVVMDFLRKVFKDDKLLNEITKRYA